MSRGRNAIILKKEEQRLSLRTCFSALAFVAKDEAMILPGNFVVVRSIRNMNNYWIWSEYFRKDL